MKTSERQLLKLASLFKALGHPLRLAILKKIERSRSGALSVKDLQELLKITQPEASRQLILLKKEGILQSERSGGHSYYSFNSKSLAGDLLRLFPDK